MHGVRKAGKDLVRVAFFAAACVAAAASAGAQTAVEPGLEKAVGWKWRAVTSSPADWVSPAPEPTPTPEAINPEPAPESQLYEVKRGDALILIARKYGLTAQHLKVFNGLPSDLIREGQVLKIPTTPEALLIAPLPEPPKKKPAKGAKKDDPGLTSEHMRTAALQAFLDRQMFSSGPIDGKRSADFEKVLHLYLLGHPEATDPARLGEAIRGQVGDGFTRYTLKPGDFRYIVPPKAAAAAGGASAEAEPAKVQPPSYDELTGAPLLLYRTPWEFVAERFHCSEEFLKLLNAEIRSAPMAGTELRVPNVAPFEIENFLRQPLQPAPNPEIKAVIADLSVLQIFQRDDLIAVMPIAMARPGLRGKGFWTILNAIPLPRLGTLQEPREQRQAPKPLYGQQDPTKEPPKPVILTTEQFLAPGPNNPVGVVWINLAKADDPETLPYGLHGTSIPDQMQSRQSIGGIQLANWDIVRAARLLAPGTPLEWKQGGLVPAAAPAAAVPAVVAP